MLSRIALVFSILLAIPAVSVRGQDGQTTLKIALYKDVPNREGIEETVRKRWNERFPYVKLQFVEWDGYKQDPADDLDVFEFDSIMLDYFVRNNFVSPLRLEEVEARDDFFGFAFRGCMIDGTCYAVPRLACTPMLLYRRGDDAIRDAKGLKELEQAIGDCGFEGPQPPKNRGLLIDLTGGTTCACFYLDAVADKEKVYSTMPYLPDGEHLDKVALDNLRLLTRMAGKKQATCEECWEKRAAWFGDGFGRAFVGWTERLAKIPSAVHKDIQVRPLPLGDSDAANLLFVDTLAVNSLLEGRRRELALEFVNLAASTGVVLDTILVKDKETGNPQYLLPVRKSVLSDPVLNRAAPLYSEIGVALTNNPRTFRIGANVRQWLTATKSKIKETITNP